MKKNICLCIAILFTSIIFGDINEEQPSNFYEKHAGSIENPYKINSLSNLYWLSANQQYWNGFFFEQTKNINAETPTKKLHNKKFLPIGRSITTFSDNNSEVLTDIVPFSSSYNGNHFLISNLKIKGDDKTNQFALFGNTNKAEIKNIILKNITVNGNSNIGALVGYANKSVIESCYSSGYVIGKSYVGGLIGIAVNSKITNCCSTAETFGTKLNIGGLVGMVSKSQITDSYSQGNVLSKKANNVGGIFGFSMSSELVNCYTNSKVDGDNNTGVLGGIATNSNITSSFWLRRKNQHDIGRNNNSFKFTVKGLSITDFNDKEYFIKHGWDFYNKWIITKGYPSLTY